MRKFSVKVIAALLVVAACISFFGCDGGKSSPIYAVNNDGKVTRYMTEGAFSFYLSQQKEQYLTVLQFNDSTLTGDSVEVWDTVSKNGRTYGEVFLEEIVDEAQDMMSAQYILFDVLGYELPVEYSEYIKGLIKNNAIEQYGSVSAFENYLGNFGTSYKDYEDLYFMTTNVDLLKELLYNDESGVMRFSDEEKKQYFADNYSTIKHIFINTTYTDKMDGTKAPITEAEMARRKEIAAELEMSLMSGAEFSDLAKIHNVQGSYVSVYDENMYIDSRTETSVRELGEAVKSMKEGEIRSVSSAYGIHIIKKLPISSDDYNKDESVITAIGTTLADADFPLRIASFRKNVKTNEEILSQFDLAFAPMP